MQVSENARAALYMMVAMAAFTMNDAAMKAASQTMPLFQAVAFRGAITFFGLVVLAWSMGALTLDIPRRDKQSIGLRCLGELMSSLLFLTALTQMPLANLSAIMQALPLALTLAAAVFLGEKIGWQRLTAIGIGFLGVVIIVRPGPEGFDIWALAGLGAVAFVVLRDLITRRVSLAVPSVMIAVFSAGAMLGLGLVGMALQGVQPMTAWQVGILLFSAAALMMGYLFAVMVMRIGDVGVVAPFRYTALLWAIFLGWLYFGQLPDPLTLLGAGLVVVTGLFTLWRETRRKKQET